MKSELLTQIIENYRCYGTSNVPDSELFAEGNSEEMCFARLHRAMYDEFMENNKAKYSRYAIWASDVISLLSLAKEKLCEGKHNELEKMLNLAANNLGAFRDIQTVFDSTYKGMQFYSVNQILKRYMLYQLNGKETIKILSREEIINNLKANYKREYNQDRKLGLPSYIDFEVKNKVLLITINNPDKNMQTNDAAFEGWILILRRWLDSEIKYVYMNFVTPRNLNTDYLAGDDRRKHYNRFLYRVYNFQLLFSDWFFITDEKENEVKEFMEWFSKGCLMNQPLQETYEITDTDKKERLIESWFVHGDGKDLICSKTGVNTDKIFNQLPVGIFNGEIRKKNAVFTGGASAIDLWGVESETDTLHIFELKCDNNTNIGVISETLFYTMIIYEACIKENSCLKIVPYNECGNFRGIDLLKNKKYKSLKVHILTEKLHSLFDNKVIDTISDGLSNMGITLDLISYNYEGKKVL